MFAQTKIIWGFVEKDQFRVEGYRVLVRIDTQEIEAQTNHNGFYQLNLGNIHSGFDNGDVVSVEAVGETHFYGRVSLTLANGTTTQQSPTIEVSEDLAPPVVLSASPTDFINKQQPEVIFDILDTDSGPDFKTFNIKYNSSDVVVNSELVNPTFQIKYNFVSTNRLVVSLICLTQMAEGSDNGFVGTIADKVGNLTELQTDFTIDVTPPEINSIEPISNSFVTDAMSSIRIGATDNIAGLDHDRTRLVVDGVVVQPIFGDDFIEYAPNLPYPNTSIITWSIELFDRAGNETKYQSSFAVFAAPPLIEHPKPSPFANTKRPAISFEISKGSSDVDLSSFKMSIGDLEVGPEDPRLVLNQNEGIFLPDFDITERTHVSVSLSDIMGLETSLNWFFSIDLEPPTIVSINHNFVPNLKYPLRFRLEDEESGIDFSSLKFVVNGVLYDNTSPDVSFGDGVFVFVPGTDYFAFSKNSLSLTISDVAGNAASPFVLDFFVDGDAPRITSVSPVPNTSTNNLRPIIVIDFEDNQSGIDESSIRVTVNNVTYGPDQYIFHGTRLTLESRYDFDKKDHVFVNLYVKDRVGNLFNAQATNFRFDLEPFVVAETKPANGMFLPVPPESWIVTFNKIVDLSETSLEEDFSIESRKTTNISPIFQKEKIEDTSGLIDEKTVSLSIVGGFKRNREYRLLINDKIKDQAGNKLYSGKPGIYETQFTVYTPGDFLMRGKITISDLYKYAKVVENCDRSIVSVVPEIADLNGDGQIDENDLSTLQSIILEEINDANVAGTEPINNEAIPVIRGAVETVQIEGFAPASIAEKTIGEIRLTNAVDIVGFQGDILFDPNVLSLIDILPMVPTDVFRYRQIAPGKVRIIILDFTGSLKNSIANVKFRVIGPSTSIIRLAQHSTEIVSITEAAVIPDEIGLAVFRPSTAPSSIASIDMEVKDLLVPSEIGETTITATLVDRLGIQKFEESIPIEWSITGNGYFEEKLTLTDVSGTSTNRVILTGGPNSSVGVSAKVRFANAIRGIAPLITIYDSKIVSLEIETSRKNLGTGEPFVFEAIATTSGGIKMNTQAVTWETTSTNAVISKHGEFVAFAPGDYFVSARLIKDPRITAISKPIHVSSVVEFFDCNDRPLLIDGATGFSKLSLGNIFSGGKTGTQEIHVKNTLRAERLSVKNDMILNMNVTSFSPLLFANFAPIASESFRLTKRSTSGKIQMVSATEGFHEQNVADLDIGMSTIYLDHVNVADVGLFVCGNKPCQITKTPFVTIKNSKAHLKNDGDFAIDEKLGIIYVLLRTKPDFLGKITYRFDRSYELTPTNGEIKILEPRIVKTGDVIYANYEFNSGKLEGVKIAVTDGPDTDILVSSDGVAFAKSAILGTLFANDIAKFYIKADSGLMDQIGLQMAEVMVEADLVSIKL